MIEADIQILAGGWCKLVGDPEVLVRRALAATASETAPPQADLRRQISIALSNNAHMQALNREHRSKDRPTNVLAFPAPESLAPADQAVFVGDVVLAFETIREEARTQHKPFANHMSHLIVHGTLHLLGYDHIRDRDAARMEAAEKAILARLGIPDPYLSEATEEAGTNPDG